MKNPLLFLILIAFFECMSGCTEKSISADQSVDLKLQMALEYVFDEANAMRVVEIKKCGLDCCEIKMTDTNGPWEPPTIRTRSEAGNDGWIFWGKVSGVVSASRMAKEMAKLYDGKCYMLKMEPIPGTEDRNVYHKPC